MPFDFSPIPLEILPQTRSREAIILDNIIAYLADRNHWIQGRVRKGTKRCLVGAIREATRTFAERRAILRIVHDALPEELQTTGWWKSPRIAAFNDNQSHARVMHVLRRARRRVT